MLLEARRHARQSGHGLTHADIKETVQQTRKVLGDVPILAAEQRLLDEHEAGAQAAAVPESTLTSPKPSAPVMKTKVLADGTYATETAFSASSAAALSAVKAATKPPLRALVLGGDSTPPPSLHRP